MSLCVGDEIIIILADFILAVSALTAKLPNSIKFSGYLVFIETYPFSCPRRAVELFFLLRRWPPALTKKPLPTSRTAEIAPCLLTVIATSSQFFSRRIREKLTMTSSPFFILRFNRQDNTPPRFESETEGNSGSGRRSPTRWFSKPRPRRT